jgi:hypothetical protein
MKNIIYIDENIPQWKGNLHMHSTRSDGELPYRQIIEAYKQMGYDFCMMSDHDIYWDSDELDTQDFLVLSGTESSTAENPNGLWFISRQSSHWMHFCAIKDPMAAANGQTLKHDEPVPRIVDTGITSWNDQIDYLIKTGHIVVLNHPRWSRISPEHMLALNGCFAMEVWNTISESLETTGESEYEWDYCLRNGKRIFAVAADDSHYLNEKIPDTGAFINVSAPKLDKVSLVDAMKSGNFYASRGPLIKDMRVQDGMLRIKCSPAQCVRLVSYEGFAPTYFAQGAPIEAINWKLEPGLKYVRAEIVDANGLKAWAQPVFLDELNE